MNRSTYYNDMKQLARDIRARYGLDSPRVLKSNLRTIYKDQGIHLDLWPHRMREVRGAYFNDEFGPTVMLVKGLPDDPAIFTMAHELKHHLVDRNLPIACCSTRNINEHIEIGAEIFAAELIYPEADFLSRLAACGVERGTCTAEHLVTLKHETRTTLSYAGLAKRALFNGLASPGTLEKVAWKKLEEQMFGVPAYKRFSRGKRAW